MNSGSVIKLTSLTVSALLLAASCSPAAKPAQKAAASEDGSSALKVDGEVFQLWCDLAGEIDVANGQRRQYYDSFCEGGKLIALFTSKLISKAYDGSDKPRVTPLSSEGFVSDNKTTAILAGVALKLPIDAQKQFDTVSPMQGDAEKAKKLGTTMFKAETLEMKTVKTYKSRGDRHVRGWDIETIATNSKPVPMTVQFTARNDQYELEKGKAYQYATYTVDGEKKTLREQVMYSAMVETEEGTFIISQIYLKTDNLGKPSIAETTIKNTLVDGAAGIWSVSNKFAE